ncbi:MULTISPECIES: ATP-dependent DNA ligase [Bradyrhizobium]|jgi:ATP-dependent DNA ligase|uniref:Bll7704 protein n=1 Tax=Bradyrhizobium diazoefficiens (strain JCM 10833 / BCRC 13528 / IAM 13628 / NBRC 14792 / USDA 110) TaxID=224911 RepID=Q89CU1_BRADU|nr:RNA ligase family protein [Bradyrhizobium diazoefficiens]MBP1061891.1 ATP-dependent DNA ligase [Bradyrhizobium japonicum]AND92609.1 DNA ligase [Bradyrhizobium diazoefficiens USDA 110]AWO94500.1 DNA ligase [Bradyrhizobium diazoefficiens]PDT55832.1 DNA ligase [Bradyrhizobium diazoefficiens]QBP26442.1 DNA ligase [Bradyrhizobium diazoefficiens]
MRSFEFCLPSRGVAVSSGPDWLHEVKYDGYRLRLEREGHRVRLITRGGYNWASRYPWIVEAARKVRQKHFVLDGEAVVLGVDGISDFNALHSRKRDHEVQFCAFDILAEGGDDHRRLSLSMRKTNLERLLARRPEGVFVNPFERGQLGPDLFRAACNMGLEGLVSKRRDQPDQAGRSKHWVKVKNRSHPAMEREL